MPQDSGITRAAIPEHGSQGSIQIPYPKFDLGKIIPLRHFRGDSRICYATIDRIGEQAARSIPFKSVLNITTGRTHRVFPLSGEF